MIEIAGQNYHAVIGSDLDRDGMFLEVTDGASSLVAILFYSDRNSEMTLTAHRPDIPLALIEWMVDEGKKRLSPTARQIVS
ncbi:MAG TPA: hypothetical protein VFH89_04250 [Sphingomicrobium sp.]|nr:hypothetical protein [Sphingomicrobium sp.]